APRVDACGVEHLRRPRALCAEGGRPPRRGEGTREGAGVLVPRRLRSMGPQEPTPGTLVPVQRADSPRREHPLLPAFELDRARYLALHRARRPRDPVDLLCEGTR